MVRANDLGTLARLFWDVDPNQIDWRKNYFFVIERVFDRGDLAQFLHLKSLYSIDEIKEVIATSKRINPRMRNFYILHFNLNPQEICIPTPSYPELWNY